MLFAALHQLRPAITEIASGNGRKDSRSMNVPIIETERLILRGHRLDDFPALAALWGDEEVTRHIGGRPSTRDESWARLLRYGGHWQLLGYGYWAVEWKQGQRFVGDVGFADWHRDIRPALDGMPEGGWVFAPETHTAAASPRRQHTPPSPGSTGTAPRRPPAASSARRTSRPSAWPRSWATASSRARSSTDPR